MRRWTRWIGLGLAGLAVACVPAAPSPGAAGAAGVAAQPGAAARPVAAAAGAGSVAEPARSSSALASAALPSPLAASPLTPRGLASPRALDLPTDVGVGIPTSLGGQGIISDQGSGVVSNQGAKLISDHGAALAPASGTRYALAATRIEPGTFFADVTFVYQSTVWATNTVLGALTAASEAEREALRGGATVTVTCYDTPFLARLETPPDRDPVLHVALADGSGLEVMRLTFSDRAHGSVIFRPKLGMLPFVLNPYNFSTTFDRVANRARVDLYTEDRVRNGGKHRVHFEIEPGTGGAAFTTRVANTLAEGASLARPPGVIAATAHSLADGSSAVILAYRPLADAGDPVLQANELAVPGAPPHAYFLDAGGNALGQVPDALRALAPQDGDLIRPYVDAQGRPGYYPAPGEVDYFQDPAFSLP